MPPSSLSLRIGVDSAALCWRCSTRLARPRFQIRSVSKTATRPATVASSRFGYFLSNASVDRKLAPHSRQHGSDTVAPPAAEGDARPPTQPELASANPAILQQELPHRRRQAERAAARRKLADASSEGTESDLPANASTILTDVAARQRSALRRHLSAFLSLTKPRLTALVVLSAMASYSLYPVPSFLGPAAGALADVSAPSLSPLTLLFLTTGTALCSGAANTLNMLYETGTDAKMSRTRNRPLVRRLLSTRAAVLFAVGASVLGVASLHFGVNPTVAFLGAANIVLYAGVYTPMKRVSVVNTWVGALVGGIPPLMGWAAAAGESATGDGTFRELLFASDGSSIGGWLLAGLLFTWEFPHFMALSWTIREDYRTAGLRMLSWTNPARNARVALRYSLLFVPLCVALCATGVTEWTFAATSLPVNAWLAREAVRFWRSEGHGGAARGLFWASVWHLPAVMVLALLQKKGMWQRVWTSITGGPQALDGEDDDDGEWEYIADENDEVEASASTSAAAKVSTIPSPGVSSRAIR